MVVMGGMSLLYFQLGPSEELPQSQVSSWSMSCCRSRIAAAQELDCNKWCVCLSLMFRKESNDSEETEIPTWYTVNGEYTFIKNVVFSISAFAFSV